MVTRYAWLALPGRAPTCVRVLSRRSSAAVVSLPGGVRLLVSLRALRQYRAGCVRLAEGRSLARSR